MEVAKIREYTGHSGGVYKITNGFQADHIVSFSGDGRVVEWNLNEKDSGILKAKSEYKFFTGLTSYQENSCFAGDMNGSLYQLFFDKKSENVKAWKTHEKGLFSIVAFENLLFTGGGDGSLTKWSIQPFLPKETKPISNQRIRSLVIDEKRKVLIAGSSDGCIYLIDPVSMQIIERREKAHDSTVFSIIMRDKNTLITGGRDAHICIWDYPKLVLAHRIPAHLFTVNDLAISPCKKYFASASRDKEIRIWDAQSFKLVKVIDRIKYGGHINSVNTLLWDNKTGFLCSGSDDRSVLVWEVKPNQ
ncbi:MAG: hypothetical protein EA362_03405 [Saprospirales bacterium]|nr:MAG: hypothetical protein EA362_03405 [Saprospirales bacterium]